MTGEGIKDWLRTPECWPAADSYDLDSLAPATRIRSILHITGWTKMHPQLSCSMANERHLFPLCVQARQNATKRRLDRLRERENTR